MTTFPNFNNKHDEDALYTPSDFLEYVKSMDDGVLPVLPENMVFVYQSALLRYIESKDDFKKSEELTKILGGTVYISSDGKIGVVAKFGIGSPIAVALLEELIALGSKRFFNIGTAGSIQKSSHLGDIILCDKSVRDEGTSHHYIQPGKYALPSKELTDSFEELLKVTSTHYTKGSSWTIDAPYRETIAEVKHYQGEGVYTVEMEASALFTVAKYRGVEIMAAFSVSDLLGDLEWKPAFSDEKTADSLCKLFDLITRFVK
jgi:uridine phosphorylase